MMLEFVKNKHEEKKRIYYSIYRTWIQIASINIKKNIW